jgi:hypothetical protein
MSGRKRIEALVGAGTWLPEVASSLWSNHILMQTKVGE